MANEYRVKDTGEIKTKEELIALNANTSFPKVWDDAIYEYLGVDVVFEAPKPLASGAYKRVVRNGVEQNSNDQWVQSWVEQDMFKDTTNQAGEVVTKAEQEKVYQENLDAADAEAVRNKRNNLLAETDWMGLSDVTMSSDWATYRQALRDISTQKDFPKNITWPEKPE